jgi:hypothetical protein
MFILMAFVWHCLFFMNKIWIFFQLFHSFTFFSNVQSQDLIYTYNTYRVYFAAVRDYLFIHNGNKFDVWNSTSHSFIRTMPAQYETFIFTDDEYYYLYTLKSYKVEIFSLDDGSLINTLYTENPISAAYYVDSKPLTWDHLLGTTPNYIHLITYNTTSLMYNIEIRNKKTFKLTKAVLISGTKYRNGIFDSISLDLNGFYILSLSSQLNNTLTSYTEDGQFLWSIKIPECNNWRTYAKGVSYFVYVFCENIIYQIMASDGTILRRLGSSGWTIKGLTNSLKDIFVFLVNSSVLQFSIAEANFLNLYSLGMSDSNLYDLGSIHFANDCLFFLVVEDSNNALHDDGNTCARGISIAQWSVKKTKDFRSLFYTDKQSTTPNSTGTILHRESPEVDGINSATFISRFSEIQKVLPQNSYFSPVLIPSVSNSFNFVYFSGGGDSTTSVCSDNLLHLIKISNINHTSSSSKSEFSYFDVRIFSNLLSKVCGSVQSSQEMYIQSAIYDYASTIITHNSESYYLLHGGRTCYLDSIRSKMFVIIITDEHATHSLYLELHTTTQIS